MYIHAIKIVLFLAPADILDERQITHVSNPYSELCTSVNASTARYL